MDPPGLGLQGRALARLAHIVNADMLQRSGVLVGHDVRRDVLQQPVVVLGRRAGGPLLVHRSYLGGRSLR